MVVSRVFLAIHQEAVLSDYMTQSSGARHAASAA
jgi:hypothetical protein